MLYKNPSRQLTKTHNGFTLIELLLVISITAIVVATAVSSSSQMASQQRVKSAANEFKGAVKLARSEARKRRRTTSVAPGGNSNSRAGLFSRGWEVYYLIPGSSERQLLAKHSINNGTINVSSDGRWFAFSSPYGKLMNGIGMDPKELCFSDSAGSSNAMRYRVTIHQASSVDVTEVESC